MEEDPSDGFSEEVAVSEENDRTEGCVIDLCPLEVVSRSILELQTESPPKE
jgi:hypothetical protein